MKSIGAIAVIAAVIASAVLFSNAPPKAVPDSIPSPLKGSASGDCLQCAQLSRQIDDLRRAMTSVEAKLAAQQIEAGWATQVASRINAAIGSIEALKDVAHTVECHEQTCRLQIEDDGSGKVNQNLPSITMGLTDVLPEVSAERIDAGNGRSTMVLYMSSQHPQPSMSK